MLDAFGVDPRDYDRRPPPVDPAGLPSGPLDPAGYAAAVSRNQYLAGKYDPDSLADHALNLVTGAMDDPVRVLTDAERIEHRALSAKIAETLDPPPTPDGARLEGMLGSPAGAIASLAVREAGGGQAAQDMALGLGAAAEGVGLAAAGARAGGATAFLGAQTGEAVPVVDEDGGERPTAALPAPLAMKPAGSLPAATDRVRALRGHGDARHGTQTTIEQQTTRVLTEQAPDGRKARTSRATRFDSPEAQLDAVTGRWSGRVRVKPQG